MLSKNTDIYNKLAKKHNIHKAVASMICNHPFLFASRKMAIPDDEKSLMFAYLFKIKLKKRLLGKKAETYNETRIKKDKGRQGIKSI